MLFFKCTLVAFVLSASFTAYMARRVYKRRAWQMIEDLRKKRREEDNVNLMDYR